MVEGLSDSLVGKKGMVYAPRFSLTLSQKKNKTNSRQKRKYKYNTHTYPFLIHAQ